MNAVYDFGALRALLAEDVRTMNLWAMFKAWRRQEMRKERMRGGR